VTQPRPAIRRPPRSFQRRPGVTSVTSVTHNIPMTTPESRTHRCEGCGYRFIPDSDDQRFCSGICAGTPNAYSLLAAVQQFARQATRGQ